jgi:hypothetical protein
MSVPQNRRYLYTLLLAAVGIFLLDRLVVEPFQDAREEMIAQRDAKRNAVRDARAVLLREKKLRQLVNDMSASLNADPSTVEGRLLHQMHDWEQQAGVSSASFQRSHGEEEHGFAQLTFEVSANGDVAAIGNLLYLMETSDIPLRIDSAEIHIKHDGDNELQVSLNISTPCQAAQKPGAPPVAANADLAGGNG